MKKMIFSLASMAMVGASIGGGTYALFSSTGSVTGNTISSGSVNLLVHNFSGNKPVNSSGIVPGQWAPDGRLELYNTGTSPAKAYMYVTNLSSSGGAICDKINLKVSTGHAGGSETENVLYNGPIAAISGASNRFETTTVPPFNQLDPNISQAIHQQAQLDVSADSAQMNQTCTWDEVFVAENVVPS